MKKLLIVVLDEEKFQILQLILMTFLFMNRVKNWNEWIWYNILTEYENKEKNIGENKNLSLKEFKQLKFELK